MWQLGLSKQPRDLIETDPSQSNLTPLAVDDGSQPLETDFDGFRPLKLEPPDPIDNLVLLSFDLTAFGLPSLRSASSNLAKIYSNSTTITAHWTRPN